MKSMNPHITFAGNAREAVAFYQSLFGGESEVFAVGDRADSGLPKDAVFHADLKGTNFRLMAADGSAKDASRISLHIHCDDKDEMERFHKALSDGGSVHSEIGPAFGGLFSMVTDRFGVSWFLTLPA